MLNDQLIAELPQLLDLRVPYFDPSFEAMIRMQAKFAEEGYEKLSGVQRCEILFMLAFFHLMPFALGISETMFETTMQQVSWMHRYGFVACIAGLKFKAHKPHQVEGVLQEMRELSICGGN